MVARGTSRAVAAAPLGAMLVGALLAGCGQDGADAGGPGATHPTQSVTQTISLTCYPQPTALPALVRFRDNHDIVQARVVATDVPRRVTEKGRVRLVYTPVVVEVTRTYQGLLAVGDRFVVRSIGGQAGGTRMEQSCGLAPASFWTPGRQVVLFTAAPSAPGDDQLARTPTFVLDISSGHVRVPLRRGGKPARLSIAALGRRITRALAG